MTRTGYNSDLFASSLAENAQVLRLPRSEGFLLCRAIGSTPWRDATGPYPLLKCSDWSGLAADIEELPLDIAAIVAVPDPFRRDAGEESLRRTFDFVRPYKTRFVAVLDRPPSKFISRHHARAASAALRRVEVERCEDPRSHLGDWVRLYESTCAKHAVPNGRRLSQNAFRAQLAMPELVMFRATARDRTVAMHLWILDGGNAYGHLAGHAPEAYRTGAAYALYWRALEWLHGRADRVDLGATADGNSSANGLAFFKRGWSNASAEGLLCGRVHNSEAYSILGGGNEINPRQFFPAYADPRAHDDPENTVQRLPH